MKKKLLVILITFATLSACNKKEIVIKDNPMSNKKIDITFSVMDGTFFWNDTSFSKNGNDYSVEIMQRIIVYLSMQKGQKLQREQFGFYQNGEPDYGYAKGTDHNIAFSVYGMSRHRSGVAVLLEDKKTKVLTAYKFQLNGIYLKEIPGDYSIKRITEYDDKIIISLSKGNGQFILPDNNLCMTKYQSTD